MKPRPVKIRKIISGGQTGADRAALDFALERGLETAGFVPKGRLAEDGRVSEKYPNLVETAGDDPAERTGLNVINSDATLLLTHGAPRGGSLLTRELAEKHRKPLLHVDFSLLSPDRAVEKTRRRLVSLGCRSLNVAGPRASEDTEIYAATKAFLEKLFRRDSGRRGGRW